MTIKATLSLLLFVLLASRVWAQPVPFRATPTLSFELLVEAQMDRASQQVVFTLDSYEVARQTIVESENRIRLDTADGKTLLLKYGPRRSAKVIPDTPVTITSTGKQQVRVPAKQIRFYRLDGKSVSIEDASRSLTESQPIFLLENTNSEPPEVAEVYQRALKPDCLIAITSKRVREIRTRHLPDSVPKPDPPAPQ